MITKYSINLTQFNNGEDEKITFPVFEQCLMYGMHKLKNAFEKGTCIIQAFLIEDSQGRRLVINPSIEELDAMEPSTLFGSTGLKLKIRKDSLEDFGRFTL
jgi:hypothetical protein